ncbi:efflux RND transporter permease subunit [Ideonella sp.]|uniref:efflux RND transporter permease subunit n=1 Tax=Ideonella sp. TaxID=1929293 RepID=UPI003BB66EF2
MWMTRVAINNPVFAAMVMVALCVLGLFSYKRLGVEQMPDISPPVVFVSIAYPGASPGAIETEITKPVESAMNAIAGVKMIRSNSLEGRSETVIEFNLDADVDQAVQDVRDKMAGVQAGLPKDTKQPFIGRFDNDNAQATVVLALIAHERSERELSLIADQTVVKRLERAEGVARVVANGLNVRQVRIDLDAARLRAAGLTPADVAQALQRANADQPVGLISNGTTDAIVRVEGRVRDPKEFANIVVARKGSGVTTLGDLGELVEADREPDSISRINGKSAINIEVFKQKDANIVRAGDAIKEAVEALKPNLPPGVELRIVYASSDWVKDSLEGVQRTLIEGALLTVAIVFLFLHSWRSTVITGLTLPISVISSFIAVHMFGFTLNFMTMMALSLCIGLLIDDAIVVRENIVRHVAMGKSHHAASRIGTDEIGLAVMATTFAICAVFVPVAFMKGIVGKFFFPFGITVTVAVLVSLFVSFTLDPMLSSVWKDPERDPVRKLFGIRHLIAWVDGGMDALHKAYDTLIVWAFSGRRYRLFVPPLPSYGRPFDAQGQRDRSQPRRLRWATITPRGLVLMLAALSFVVAIGLTPLIGAETMPQTDQGYTQIQIKLPVGSSLARSDEKIRQVEAIVQQFPEIATMTTNVGGEGGRNSASMGLSLKPRAERQRSQKELEDAIRNALAAVPGIDIALGWNRPINVAVLGPDPQVLDQITTDLAAKIKAIKGVTDLESSVKPGVPAYAVRIKPDAVRELGLSTTDLAASLRTFVNGDVATYWTTPDGQQVEVQLRLGSANRQEVAQLRQLPVAYAKDGTPIPLERVVTIEPVENPVVIKRQNLERRQAIYAGVDNASGRAVGDVSGDVQKLVKATVLPPGYRFDVGGQAKEQGEIFGNIFAALGLAVVFIYIVLASQFGSFLQPIAIMASLPLSLIGVMLALLISGSTINLFSMIGLIMLMGLVTKNAILLVDFANHAVRAGQSVADAVREAGSIRMRPIIMTTAAMVFGMLPLALALNEGGELQAPMGRAIIGGVITSTLLTLLVVPVIYSYLVRPEKMRAAAARAAEADQELLAPADLSATR